MTDKERIKILEQSCKNLEKRVVDLEEQLALCLRAARKWAEMEAQKKDPSFKPSEKAEA